MREDIFVGAMHQERILFGEELAHENFGNGRLAVLNYIALAPGLDDHARSEVDMGIATRSDHLPVVARLDLGRPKSWRGRCTSNAQRLWRGWQPQAAAGRAGARPPHRLDIGGRLQDDGQV